MKKATGNFWKSMKRLLRSEIRFHPLLKLKTTIMKLRISVTKEILEKSKMCVSSCSTTGTSCAIALAVRDIFPNAYVEVDYIKFDRDFRPRAVLPSAATVFIQKFDIAAPEQRVQMDPISFEVDVPDEVINRINIDEIEELLKNHPTLQFV